MFIAAIELKGTQDVFPPFGIRINTYNSFSDLRKDLEMIFQVSLKKSTERSIVKDLLEKCQCSFALAKVLPNGAILQLEIS